MKNPNHADLFRASFRGKAFTSMIMREKGSSEKVAAWCGDPTKLRPLTISELETFGEPRESQEDHETGCWHLCL